MDHTINDQGTAVSTLDLLATIPLTSYVTSNPKATHMPNFTIVPQSARFMTESAGLYFCNHLFLNLEYIQ